MDHDQGVDVTFLLIIQTDSNKFFLVMVSRLSRDFLGGLAEIFSRLSLGLAAIFAAAA